MFIATAVASVVLAGLLLASAWGKLTGDPMQTATLARVGMGRGTLPYLAAAEIAGALGLLAGLYWWPLGAAAGVGIVLYFTGAIASHLLARDWQIAPPAVLLAVAAAVVSLRLISA